jgi:hypothetical protein
LTVRLVELYPAGVSANGTVRPDTVTVLVALIEPVVERAPTTFVDVEITPFVETVAAVIVPAVESDVARNNGAMNSEATLRPATDVSVAERECDPATIEAAVTELATVTRGL